MDRGDYHKKETMNSDTVCNPDAESLNRALRRHVRARIEKQDLEILWLSGLCRQLRRKAERAFLEFLADE